VQEYFCRNIAPFFERGSTYGSTKTNLPYAKAYSHLFLFFRRCKEKSKDGCTPLDTVTRAGIKQRWMPALPLSLFWRCSLTVDAKQRKYEKPEGKQNEARELVQIKIKRSCIQARHENGVFQL